MNACLNEKTLDFPLNPCYHSSMSFDILGLFDRLVATDHPNKYMSHDMAA